MRLPFLSFALAAAALVACGGSTDQKSAPEPAAGEPNASSALSFTAFCAAPGSSFDFEERRIFEALAPSPAADYLALRHLEGGFDGPPKRATITVAERGTRCATASDATNCESKYASLRFSELFFNYVFYTRGDEMDIVRSAGGAMKLLGVVDSPEEAYYLAWFHGYHVTCSGEAAAAWRPASGAAFDIVTQTGGCMSPVDRAVVRVHPDGTIEELERREIGPEQGCM